MLCFATFFLLICFCLTPQDTVAQAVAFNRDVAPILAAKCYECHGPDKEQREAGLRFDQEANATTELDSGATAIVPGRSDASELIRRIAAVGEERIPQPKRTSR